MSKDTDLKGLVTAYTVKDGVIAARGTYIHRLVTVYKMSSREVAEYVTANVPDFKLNYVEVTTHVNVRKATVNGVTAADYTAAYYAVKSAVRDGDTPRKAAILKALTDGATVEEAVTAGKAAATKGKDAPEGAPVAPKVVTAESLLASLDKLLATVEVADEVTRRAFREGFIARAAALGAEGLIAA